MPSWTLTNWMLSTTISLVLTCASATYFLIQRCRGAGRPFGRSSRVWALLVIGVTSLLSTGVALTCAAIVAHLPIAFFGLGVFGPGGLWLSQIHNRRAERQGLMHGAVTLWLSRLLTRLQESMAIERNDWCDRRLDQEWSTSELSMAARHYQRHVRDWMSPKERSRSRIYSRLTSIETRLDIVQLIDNGAGSTDVLAALQASPVTRKARYSNHLGDLGGMAKILRHDAEQDFLRLLDLAYGSGYYRIPPFSPPRRINTVADVPARSTRARA